MKSAADISAIRARWEERWPAAIDLWSRFTKLREPRWCLTVADEREERLASSFAMIRLDDHAVVVSLRQVAEMGLEDFPVEVMAHEIGHHVYCPADLNDQARMIARIRRALPTKEAHAALVANLYADLLINDRLQRASNLRMGDVYRKLAGETGDTMWTFYMRIYEILWSLPKGSIATGEITQGLDIDASLGARVVRVYAKDWLKGAGRFAMLCFPYLADNEGAGVRKALRGWLDTEAMPTDGVPDGLAELDDDELEDPLHPALDPELGGVTPDKPKGKAKKGDTEPRERYRGPFEYREILNSLGVKLSPEEITARYYRERAIPYLVPFPVRQAEQSSDPLPEGLESWEMGESLEELDVFESLMLSNQVIPGVTTVQRTWGTSPGSSPERLPLDLYIGIDCSGSMANPAVSMSFPVLAGTIVAISALRAGARVMVCLSGEPGSYSATDGFIRDEHEILRVLTGYLGTGYAFGIHRLKFAFGKRKPTDRPAHILVVSDHDIFAMLGEKGGKTTGWERAKLSLDAARGGGTYILHMQPQSTDGQVSRMRNDGWDIVFVTEWKDILAFAREFAKKNYERAKKG